MSVLSDLVVAELSSANKVCENINSEEFFWLETPGLGTQKLLSLAQIFKKNSTFDIPCVFEKNSDGPWLYKIPDELVLAISKINDQAIPKIVDQWTTTEDEFQIERWPAKSVKGLIDALQLASREALARNKPLLLRQSL